MPLFPIPIILVLVAGPHSTVIEGHPQSQHTNAQLILMTAGGGPAIPCVVAACDTVRAASESRGGEDGQVVSVAMRQTSVQRGHVRHRADTSLPGQTMLFTGLALVGAYVILKGVSRHGRSSTRTRGDVADGDPLSDSSARGG